MVTPADTELLPGSSPTPTEIPDRSSVQSDMANAKQEVGVCAEYKPEIDQSTAEDPSLDLDQMLRQSVAWHKMFATKIKAHKVQQEEDKHEKAQISAELAAVRIDKLKVEGDLLASREECLQAQKTLQGLRESYNKLNEHLQTVNVKLNQEKVLLQLAKKNHAREITSWEEQQATSRKKLLQQQHTIKERESKINDMTRQLNAAHKRNEHTTKANDALNSTITELRGGVQSHKRDIDTLGKEKAELKKDLSRKDDELQDLRTRHTGLLSRKTNLKAEFEQYKEEAEEKLIKNGLDIRELRSEVERESKQARRQQELAQTLHKELFYSRHDLATGMEQLDLQHDADSYDLAWTWVSAQEQSQSTLSRESRLKAELVVSECARDLAKKDATDLKEANAHLEQELSRARPIVESFDKGVLTVANASKSSVEMPSDTSKIEDSKPTSLRDLRNSFKQSPNMRPDFSLRSQKLRVVTEMACTPIKTATAVLQGGEKVLNERPWLVGAIPRDEWARTGESTVDYAERMAKAEQNSHDVANTSTPELPTRPADHAHDPRSPRTVHHRSIDDNSTTPLSPTPSNVGSDSSSPQLSKISIPLKRPSPSKPSYPSSPLKRPKFNPPKKPRRYRERQGSSGWKRRAYDQYIP